VAAYVGRPYAAPEGILTKCRHLQKVTAAAAAVRVAADTVVLTNPLGAAAALEEILVAFLAYFKQKMRGGYHC
jgi:hypothetical protein